MPSKLETLSIIIPAYNEAEQIKGIIKEIKYILEQMKIKNEIIVVDDGSADNTGLMAKENGADKVIFFVKQVGKINALIDGMKYASGSIIVTIDADGYYKPVEIPKLINPILNKKADVVIGVRFIRNHISQRHRFFQNQFLNTFFFKLIEKILNIKLTDVFSSFRALSIDSVNKLIDLHILSNNPIDLELNILLKLIGIRVIEIPVEIRLRKSFGYSSPKFMSSFRMLLQIYSVILRGINIG